MSNVATTAAPVQNEQPKAKKAKKPKMQKYVFENATELKTACDDIASRGGRKFQQFKINMNGRDYFVAGENQHFAVGRLYEHLGLSVERLDTPVRTTKPLTAETFVNSFQTMSDDDRKKILDALKNAGKPAAPTGKKS